jgi:hypothetical protein
MPGNPKNVKKKRESRLLLRLTNDQLGNPLLVIDEDE